jgi:hypothetical protein
MRARIGSMNRAAAAEQEGTKRRRGDWRAEEII